MNSTKKVESLLNEENLYYLHLFFDILCSLLKPRLCFTLSLSLVILLFIKYHLFDKNLLFDGKSIKQGKDGIKKKNRAEGKGAKGGLLGKMGLCRAGLNREKVIIAVICTLNTATNGGFKTCMASSVARKEVAGWQILANTKK